MTVHLRLLGRAYCHLCDEMAVALQPLLDEYSCSLDIIDVDEHPELEDKYGELVPVLMAEDQQLCHYFLDTLAVRAYLSEVR